MSTYIKGIKAEELVMDKLKRHGLKLLAHRYKTDYGELDIVMKHVDVIVFIEVKCRKTFYSEFTISDSQIERNRNAAEYFLCTEFKGDYASGDYSIRFDVAMVSEAGGGLKLVEYIKNAY